MLSDITQVLNVKTPANLLTKPSELEIQDKGSTEILEHNALKLDVLEIIGEAPVVKQAVLNVSSHISTRWLNWLKVGMQKGAKDALLQKYPRSGDCCLEAPSLNAEIKACLHERALKKDNYFATTQNLVGSALSALSVVIEPLLTQNGEINSNKMLEHLWEASQLLIEIHRSQTVARRASIFTVLEKSVVTTLEKIETDSFLFGNNLTEKIKESKSGSKIGNELKTQPKKPVYKRPSPNNLNSSGPSAYRPTTQRGWKRKYLPSRLSGHSHRSKQLLASTPKQQYPNKQGNRK